MGEKSGFTADEKYHLEITAVLCQYAVADISAEDAMEKLQKLNVKHINGEFA